MNTMNAMSKETNKTQAMLYLEKQEEDGRNRADS